MRFLFTLHNFFPERIYGAETVAMQEMRDLLKRGHEVGLFYSCNTPAPSEQLTENSLEGLELFRVEFIKTKAQVLLSVWKPHITRRFAEVVDGFAPDVVVFHHLVRLSLDLPSVGWRRKIPMVYYLHDFYPICPSYSLFQADGEVCSGPGLLKCARCLYASRFDRGTEVCSPVFVAALPFLLLRNQLRKHLEERIDLFVSPSMFLIEEMKRQGFVAKGSVIIPYGADMVHSININKPIPTNTIRFGYLGNTTVRKKGLDVLVKAFHGHLGDSLVIRGFPDKQAMKTFKQTFPDLRASLEVFDRDKKSFYNNVDVAIVPSIWYENQPAVIIEAFSFGKPVICSDLGGMAEMVKHHAWGLLYKAGDADDLRAKVEYLLNNPTEVVRLSSSVPCWPTVEENVDKLIEAVAGILASASARPCCNGSDLALE